MDEKELVAEYLKNGVDVPELKEQPEEKKEDEAKESPKDEESEQETKEDVTEDSKEDLQAKEEPRKRDIYEVYKEKKHQLKTEKELREAAERERDEYRQKLEALEQAKTPQERQEASDELEAFAQEIGADAQALKKMQQLFLKNVKPADDSLAKDLQEFKAWKAQNSHVIEKQLFEEEFAQTVPSLKKMFPTVNDEELVAIKTKLDEVSHSKEYHDKELEYVAYKNQDTLRALVSPKKRGMETKGRAEAEEESNDFDPNADYSKMTPKQRDAWEKEYKKLTSNTDLVTDADGNKLLV